MGLSLPVGDTKAAVLVAEGLPPISTKLLDKIRRWEFVDLSLLLHDPSSKAEELLWQQKGQVMIVQSIEQAQRRCKQITDIFSWTKAFAIYCAALSSAEETTKEESVGLWSHLHLITQLSRDLGGGLWLGYDSDFREWAAAKGVRKWGEINLSIYGKCLAGRVTIQTQPSPISIAASPKGQKRSKPSSVCFDWNFSGACTRGESSCRFVHACYHCNSSSHKARECRENSGKVKKGKTVEMSTYAS